MTAFQRDSAEGRKWVSRATACFYSDVPCFGDALPASAVKVNLWHGMPIKDVGRFGTLVDDMAIATCRESQTVLSRAFGHSLEKVPITGQPKNDVLFRPVPRPPALEHFGPDCRIVSYMPTYRGDFLQTAEHTRSNPSGILLASCLTGELSLALESLLERRNAVLVIKPHLRNRPPAVALSRVVIMDEYDGSTESLDSHELMSISDVFITDYSSVYFDFLLTGRPLIVFAPDFEDYARKQNLLYDLRALAAGAFADSETELLRLIDQSLENPAWNEEERRAMSDRFNVHQDGRSSARVVVATRSLQRARRRSV